MGRKQRRRRGGEALYIPWVHLPGRAAVDVFSPSPSLEPRTPVSTQERRRKPGAVSGHATLQVLLHWSGVRWDRLGDGGRGARPMTRLPPCNGAFQNRSHALSGPMRGCGASVSAVRISALGTPRGVWARAHAPLRRCRPSPTVLPSAVGQTFPPLSPSHPAKSGPSRAQTGRKACSCPTACPRRPPPHRPARARFFFLSCSPVSTGTGRQENVALGLGRPGDPSAAARQRGPDRWHPHRLSILRRPGRWAVGVDRGMIRGWGPTTRPGLGQRCQLWCDGRPVPRRSRVRPAAGPSAHPGDRSEHLLSRTTAAVFLGSWTPVSVGRDHARVPDGALRLPLSRSAFSFFFL